ncbi:hypothetical protein BDF19DRAFT_416116 [Syncephalis fuscata]|nr:hypothetical protein BDF19DRAFT_416116 [Syncephalis fuscata]
MGQQSSTPSSPSSSSSGSDDGDSSRSPSNNAAFATNTHATDSSSSSSSSSSDEASTLPSSRRVISIQLRSRDYRYSPFVVRRRSNLERVRAHRRYLSENTPRLLNNSTPMTDSNELTNQFMESVQRMVSTMVQSNLMTSPPSQTTTSPPSNNPPLLPLSEPSLSADSDTSINNAASNPLIEHLARQFMEMTRRRFVDNMYPGNPFIPAPNTSTLSSSGGTSPMPPMPNTIPTATPLLPSASANTSPSSNPNMNDTVLGRLFMAAAGAALRHSERSRTSNLDGSASSGMSSPSSSVDEHTTSSANGSPSPSSTASTVPRTLEHLMTSTAAADHHGVRDAYARFLSSLSLLRRSNSDETDQSNSARQSNFVRVYRLDGLDTATSESSNEQQPSETTRVEPSTISTTTESSNTVQSHEGSTRESTPETTTPLVPVIIVGIRNIQPSSSQNPASPFNPSSHSTDSNNNVDSNHNNNNNNPLLRQQQQQQNEDTNTLSHSMDPLSATPSTSPPLGQSFIIYIIGSSYPANHPILQNPDMNLSEDASYEDLLRLASIIGPARPITATQEAIDEANLELRTLNLSKKTNSSVLMVDSNEDNSENKEDPLSDDSSTDEVLFCDPPKSLNTPISNTPATANGHLKRKRLLSNDFTDKPCVKAIKTGLEDLMAVERCSICLTDWEDQDVIRVLRCRHAFHRDCVDHWLREGADRCPVCRMEAVKLPTPSTDAATNSNSNENTASHTHPMPSVSST